MTPKNVLIICAGNSARSIMAEALFNFLPICKGRFRAFSAGSFPIGAINPYAEELLMANDIPTTDLRSKSWHEFAGQDSPEMAFIITVCDLAASQQCPHWPGKPITAQWHIPDPVLVGATKDEKQRAFKDAFMTLRRRIELFSSLPLDKLDELAMKTRMAEIGSEEASA